MPSLVGSEMCIRDRLDALYHISSLISSRFEKNVRDTALYPGAPGQGCWMLVKC